MVGIVKNAFHGGVSDRDGPTAWLRISERLPASAFQRTVRLP